MQKVIPLSWGNSVDKSVSGIVLVEDDNSRRLFFGSRQVYTDEQDDANYIAKWGDEITKEQLKSLLDVLEKGDKMGGYYYIADTGCVAYEREGKLSEIRKACGNHFLAREEAEKELSKILSMARLKDKGLRIASAEVVEEPYNGLGQDVFRVEFVVDDLRGHRYQALDYEKDKDLEEAFELERFK